MFSQWIQAVENLAQQSPKSSQDMPAETPQTRSSLDKGRRGSQSSIKQRTGSPARRAVEGAKPRSTLEDRLRAKLAVVDTSNPTTPAASSRTSPTSDNRIEHPSSPASTPLPDSPSLSTVGSGNPLDALSQPLSDIHAARLSGGEGRHSPGLVLRTEFVHVVDPDVTWHPLSPTLAPLPNSPPSSPTVDAPLRSTVASLHQFLNDPGAPPGTSDIGLPGADSEPQVEMAVVRNSSSSSTLPNGDPSSEGLLNASPEHDEIHHTTHREESSSVSLLIANSESATSEESPGSVETLDSSASQALMDAPDLMIDHSLPTTPDRTSSPPLQGESKLAASLSSDGPEERVMTSLSDQFDHSPRIIDTLAQTSLHVPLVAESTVISVNVDDGGVQDEGLVEGLQKRLKLVEQRFSDVSTSFKRLQAEKVAADKVLQELTPLQSVQEVDSLRDFIQNVTMKAEMAQDEIKRLTGKLTRQEERIEELRDIHRLESKSQSDQIEKLKAQIDEAEALLKASQGSSTQVEAEAAKQKEEVERLRKEVDHLKGVVKDEEEKRVKAVGLLKTVRQKLVKAEKERDDAVKEVQGVKDKENGELEKERAEKAELMREIERANSDRETTINGLKSHFDKEVSALKEKHGKELTVMKSQFDIEAITTKTSLVKEMEIKDTRIMDLECLVRSLEGEKDDFFDQLQLRQAELESSRFRLESLEGQTTEFQYQLREANDRIALLTEELADTRREQETMAHSTGPSAEDVTRLLASAETKCEARICDLRGRLSIVERERDEGEALWSRKLAEKTRELESLKEVLNLSARSREQESESAGTLKDEIEKLKDEARAYQLRISDMRSQAERAAESENVLKSQIADLDARITALLQLIEEGKAREAQLRANNKTLREELRKVQSSAALLERQRNPGVGYWASRQDATGERSPRSSMDGLGSPSRPGSPAVSQSDEEINIEYLRNVILQFLEHKEMRPHLVRILSTILRFTPQETRRIVSKV